ncbi:MAG: aminomethyl-transferring glycine dehydrogenase subunit GcvPB [Opitutae bacterium]
MSIPSSSSTKSKSFEFPELPYNPQEYPRESARHYVSASQQDLDEMLAKVGARDLEDLFAHLPPSIKFPDKPVLPDELTYEDASHRLFETAKKTNLLPSFIGDLLPVWKVHPITNQVAQLRPLSTSYTPYQPERSQGTLVTHWIYQCVLSALTGFEAINTSLYDRSAAIFEAVCCARRSRKRPGDVLLAQSLFEEDVSFLKTHAQGTDLRFKFSPVDPATGRLDYHQLEVLLQDSHRDISAFVFPQLNGLGLLEDVDRLADFAARWEIPSIAVIDPMLLASGGLKPPTEFGTCGVDFIAGEAQHLAIPPSFGGPGLGLFGCRHNEKTKRDLRNTPGRYIGRAKDSQGRDCFVMVLSTREQHIRKEKATSNVCSNQAFLATIAGANLLAKGESGLKHSLAQARKARNQVSEWIRQREGIELAYPDTPSFNDLLVTVSDDYDSLLDDAREQGIHLGVDVSTRLSGANKKLYKISFSDIHDENALARLKDFIFDRFPACSKFEDEIGPPAHLLRTGPANLPSFSHDELLNYYEQLANLNVSPDDGCYPLGSCTMKYNPMLNDWAAGLDGFSQVHPQSPEADAQGPLEVLYEIQKWFKAITGLAGVTTQPVAGAQGELVGLKLFQAYHHSRGEGHRNVVLIPKSAHGTNFATAATAGYGSGIVYLQANDEGMIDLQDFRAKIKEHGQNLCGIMITNPNTSGIFEEDFSQIAKEVHTAGGLVYMDGANMNAIAGIVDLGRLGVDAVHNNLHKTWTIPHGGGGPGDAIVAVSDCLVDFLPGKQIRKDEEGSFHSFYPSRSIGTFHRNWGNFGHKVRAYAYLLRLGNEGVPRMSSIAVLSARYLFEVLRSRYPTLPAHAGKAPRMHEFILTLSDQDFAKLENAGIPKSQAIPQVGKLFLDFGFHAPTVAFPEVYGLMIEPTESYTKKELDRFAHAVIAIKDLIEHYPQVVAHAPHFTPIDRVDEVSANRNLCLAEKLDHLPALPLNRIQPRVLLELEIEEIKNRILRLHDLTC